jgi:hypothetical protein
LAVQLVPAIARQSTARVADPQSTLTAARVVAGSLRALRSPAEMVFVEVTAYSPDAWSDRGQGAGAGQSASSGGSQREPHCCVETGGVLIDACLELLSVPGGSLTLRPSWFDLPASWSGGGYATFRQQQTGAVVSYIPAPPRYAAVDEGAGNELLIHRLVMEVVDVCRKAQRALAGVEPAPARWVPVTD